MKAYLDNKPLQYNSINAQLFFIYAITDPHSGNKIREWTTEGFSKHQGSAQIEQIEEQQNQRWSWASANVKRRVG